MDGRKIILLVGALLVAAITAFLARNLLVGAPAPTATAETGAAAAQPTTEVLVATRALPVGTILDAGAMQFVAWPDEMIENAYYLKNATDMQALQGTVVRFSIPAGQPIAQGALVKPGDRGFLAAALGPGMRAVTVPVSTQSAVAGFVFPGDRVDLILTQSVEGGGDGPPLKASETVLRNLRVLATDQQTDRQTDEDGRTVVNTYSTVTVEATPKIAEKIAVAQTIGDISLSLRSLADTSTELEEAIATGAISVPDSDDPDAERRMLAAAGARPIEGGSSYSTGADVSRFQRSTVPARSERESGPTPYPNTMPQPVVPNGMTLPQMPTGPVVRVARGNNVTVVPLGTPNASGGAN